MCLDIKLAKMKLWLRTYTGPQLFYSFLIYDFVFIYCIVKACGDMKIMKKKVLQSTSLLSLILAKR